MFGSSSIYNTLPLLPPTVPRKVFTSGSDPRNRAKVNKKWTDYQIKHNEVGFKDRFHTLPQYQHIVPSDFQNTIIRGATPEDILQYSRLMNISSRPGNTGGRKRRVKR